MRRGDADQPGHLPSPHEEPCAFSYHWVHSLHWTHRSFCWLHVKLWSNSTNGTEVQTNRTYERMDEKMKLYTPRHKCRGYNEEKYIIDYELHPICEQRHDKTNKMTYAQSKDTDEPWHLPSLISRCCLHEEPCTFSYPLSAQSSLGAQVILLFLSCNSSYDCHIIRPTLKLFLFPFTKQLYLKEKGCLVGETFLYFWKRENEFQNMIKIYVSKPTEFL